MSPWLFVVPVAIVALVFILLAVRNVSRSMRTLAASVNDLRDLSVGISQMRAEAAGMRPADDKPPQ